MSVSGLRSRRLRSMCWIGLYVVMGLLAMIPALSILGEVLVRGLIGLSPVLLTQLPVPFGMVGGIANAIAGTVWMTGLAAIIAIPLGVGTGIYLSEYRGNDLIRVIRFLVNILAELPAIIAGLVIYATVVLAMGDFSALAGSLALAFLLFPRLARSTEAGLQQIADDIREGAFAIGATKRQMILRMLLPTAARSLSREVLLAIAQIMGETAPLLFTAFGNSYWQTRLTGPTAALPLQIFDYAISPYPAWQAQAWTSALTLLLFILLIHVGANVIGRRSIK